MLASTPHETPAQNSLAFSKDGRVLYEVLFVDPVSGDNLAHVRAISYNAATGKQLRTLDLGDTWFFSATADGRFGIISDRQDPRTRVFRVDLETGHQQELPSMWFDADDRERYAQISGDGRLVSAYSGEGPEDTEVVTVYDWRTKKLVAKQSSEHSAGGFDSGGVTEDGRIGFYNNRWGSTIVDPKTGRELVSYGSAIRSPDGAWVVEFSDPGDPADSERNFQVLNGMNGQTAGRLELPLTAEAENWGAFCGTSGRFIAVIPDEVLAFEVPSGKKLASLPPDTWKDLNAKGNTSVACSPSGKRVAVRNGSRLTLHDLN